MICFIFLCFVLFSYSFGSPTECGVDNTKRIVGGEPADIKDVPYQLALEYYSRGVYSQECAGAVIGPSVALSAAHCVHGQHKPKRLRAGSSLRHEGGVLHYVKEIIIHPNHDYYTLDYDVCVIKVTAPFTYTETVQPIALATKTPSAGTPAVVSGWGETRPKTSNRPKQLQKVTVQVLKPSVCESCYLVFTRRMLCAGFVEGQRGFCNGDSGGPLVAQKELIGIVSGGIGCARPGYPGVYTDVAQVHNWISKTIGKTGTKE